MTDPQCDALQDRWLALPGIRTWVAHYGEDHPISGVKGSPTFRDVRETLLPAWRDWFQDRFE